MFFFVFCFCLFLLLQDGPACELCELLVQTIDQYLKDNKTAAAINATVYKLCNDLPDTLKTTVSIQAISQNVLSANQSAHIKCRLRQQH